MLLFSNFTFAKNVNENNAKANTYAFGIEDFADINETRCYDVFVSAYNVRISLGHSAEVAHTRASRTLNACLTTSQSLQP